LSDELDLGRIGDVAGIQSEAMHARVERCERHAVIVVNVGNDGHRRSRHDTSETFGGFGLVARAANDVRSCSGESIDLLQRALMISCLGDRHRLNGDGRTPTDGNIADHDLLGLLPVE